LSLSKFLIIFALVLFSFALVPEDAFAHYGEVLSGYGTATIDGVRSAGEWDGADVISVFGDKSENSVLLVMNDDDNLYFGLYVVDDLLAPNDNMGFSFDNSHNGIFDVNDDSGGVTASGGIADNFFNGTFFVRDPKIHGIGVAQNDGSGNFWEFSKPLRSGDEGDFNLSVGDTLGFCLTYSREGVSPDGDQYGPSCRYIVNEQQNYGDILIIPHPVFWDGKMAMDADKRNVEHGQIIKYEGYLYGNYPIEDEVVSVMVTEKETGKIILKKDSPPDSSATEYFENTAWPFTFQVSTSSEEFVAGMTYVVKAQYADQSTKLEFFIQPGPKLTCLQILEDNPIIVLTDKEEYDQGDIISISGCLSREAFVKEIDIAVYDPEGTKIGVSTIFPNPDGAFSEEFVINELFGLNGTYFVEVNAGGLYSTSKSFVVPEFGAIAMMIFGASVALIIVNRQVFKL